ncbi:MAG: hypothetical protein ACREF3_16375, partial [Acetobacteraceae bacterium]
MGTFRTDEIQWRRPGSELAHHLRGQQHAHRGAAMFNRLKADITPAHQHKLDRIRDLGKLRWCQRHVDLQPHHGGISPCATGSTAQLVLAGREKHGFRCDRVDPRAFGNQTACRPMQVPHRMPTQHVDAGTTGFG